MIKYVLMAVLQGAHPGLSKHRLVQKDRWLTSIRQISNPSRCPAPLKAGSAIVISPRQIAAVTVMKSKQQKRAARWKTPQEATRRCQTKLLKNNSVLLAQSK